MKKFKEFLEEEKSNTDFIIRDYVIPTISDSMLYAIELQQYLDNINWGNVARKGRDVALEVVSAQMNPFNRFNLYGNY